MTFKIQLLGAVDTVTGSRALVTHGHRRWLIDCGLFQGDKVLRERNRADFPIDPRTLDGVVLTHADLDHSGYLPRLVREGFNGRIVASEGTVDLARILLMDAARLEEEGANYANETGHSRHKPAIPLFTADDAARAIARLEGHKRHEWV